MDSSKDSLSLGAAPRGIGLRLGPWQLDMQSRRDTGRLLVGFLVFHLLLWVVSSALTHRAPPWDNIEQLVWQQSLQWGYYKHPPFPTWWLSFWTTLLGKQIWVTFFAAQLSVVLMLYMVWRIGLLVMSPARALSAVLLSSLLIYHGIHGIMANHNTVQLMPVALLLWTGLLAVREGGWGRWLLAGLAAALCMLTKYSALIWLAVLGLWMLQDVRMRRLRPWLGAGLALLVAAVLFAPHIQWLLREGAPSLGYVSKAVNGENDASTLGHWGRLANFVVIQFGRALPLLLATGLMAWLLRGKARWPLADAPERPEARFITFMALGPVLLTSLLGVAGVKLGSAWAATFFVVLGLWLMRFVPAHEPNRMVRTALTIAVVFELLMALSQGVVNGWLVDLKDRPARANFPAQSLAAQVDAVWRKHQPGALHIVVGETWLAGNVSVHAPTHPLVFLDADPQKSPWVKPEMIRQCGALLVVDVRDLGQLPAAVDDLREQAYVQGQIDLPWTRRGTGPHLQVEWSIVAPEKPGLCPLH